MHPRFLDEMVSPMSYCSSDSSFAASSCETVDDRLSQLSASVGGSVQSVDEYFARLGVRRAIVCSRGTPGASRTPPPPFTLDAATPQSHAGAQKWRDEAALALEVMEAVAAVNDHVAMPFDATADRRGIFVRRCPHASTITEYMMGIFTAHRGGQASLAVTLLTLLHQVTSHGGVPFTPLTAHQLIAGALAVALSLEDADDRERVLLLTGLRVHVLVRLERVFLRMLEQAAGARRRGGEGGSAQERMSDGVDMPWDDIVGRDMEATVRTRLPRIARWHQKNFATRMAAGGEVGAAAAPLLPAAPALLRRGHMHLTGETSAMSL